MWGVDYLGRDLFQRWISATELTVWIGISGASLGLTLGLLLSILGMFRIFRPGILFLLDVAQAIPLFLLPASLLMLFKQVSAQTPQLNLILALGLSAWLVFARYSLHFIRVQMALPLFESAASLGGSSLHIWRKHLVPLLMRRLAPIIAAQTSQIILFESLFSFVGFGLRGEQVTLGGLLSEVWSTAFIHPHLLLLPGVTIMAISLLFSGIASHIAGPKLASPVVER